MDFMENTTEFLFSFSFSLVGHLLEAVPVNGKVNMFFLILFHPLILLLMQMLVDILRWGEYLWESIR